MVGFPLPENEFIYHYLKFLTAARKTKKSKTFIFLLTSHHHLFPEVIELFYLVTFTAQKIRPTQTAETLSLARGFNGKHQKRTLRRFVNEKCNKQS